MFVIPYPGSPTDVVPSLGIWETMEGVEPRDGGSDTLAVCDPQCDPLLLCRCRDDAALYDSPLASAAAAAKPADANEAAAIASPAVFMEETRRNVIARFISSFCTLGALGGS